MDQEQKQKQEEEYRSFHRATQAVFEGVAIGGFIFILFFPEGMIGLVGLSVTSALLSIASAIVAK